MTDAGDRPVQMLCARNLRQSLRRRLGVAAAGGEGAEYGDELESRTTLSKRVDYREVVRKIYWRRVDSQLEMDLFYLEAVRAIFPETYETLVGRRPVWFLHVDAGAEFPRFVRTSELTLDGGVLLGPIEEKGQAQKLVEQLESDFDLCRYHNILTQAPNGKACAYKEMGRCPAPCDGTIGLGDYRAMIEKAVEVLRDPEGTMRRCEAEMRDSAAGLDFERAAKLKKKLEGLAAFRRGPFRMVRRLEDFCFVSFQPGPRAGQTKVFLITPGEVSEELGLYAEPVGREVLDLLLAVAESRRARTVDATGAERLSVVVSHLFATKNAVGVFVRLGELDEKGLARAYREAQKKPGGEATEGTMP